MIERFILCKKGWDREKAKIVGKGKSATPSVRNLTAPSEKEPDYILTLLRPFLHILICKALKFISEPYVFYFEHLMIEIFKLACV